MVSLVSFSGGALLRSPSPYCAAVLVAITSKPSDYGFEVTVVSKFWLRDVASFAFCTATEPLIITEPSLIEFITISSESVFKICLRAPKKMAKPSPSRKRLIVAWSVNW